MFYCGCFFCTVAITLTEEYVCLRFFSPLFFFNVSACTEVSACAHASVCFSEEYVLLSMLPSSTTSAETTGPQYTLHFHIQSHSDLGIAERCRIPPEETRQTKYSKYELVQPWEWGLKSRPLNEMQVENVQKT